MGCKGFSAGFAIAWETWNLNAGCSFPGISDNAIGYGDSEVEGNLSRLFRVKLSLLMEEPLGGNFSLLESWCEQRVDREKLILKNARDTSHTHTSKMGTNSISQAKCACMDLHNEQIKSTKKRKSDSKLEAKANSMSQKNYLSWSKSWYLVNKEN